MTTRPGTGIHSLNRPHSEIGMRMLSMPTRTWGGSGTSRATAADHGPSPTSFTARTWML